MKKCAYCGRQSEAAATHCGECGTEFTVPAPPVQSATEPDVVRFTIDPLPESERTKDLVTLVSCRSMMEAEAVLCELRSIGIDAFIPDQAVMQVLSFPFGVGGYVRVQVPPSDYETARELLTS